MRAKWILLVVASFAAFGCNGTQSVGSAAGGAAGKPEDAVKAFVDAVNKKDTAAARACLFSTGAPGTDDALKGFPMELSATDYKVDLTEPYLANVSFNLNSKMTAPDQGTPPPPSTDHLSLILTKGNWKILPGMMSVNGSQNEMSLSALVSLLNMSQVFAKARDTAKSTVSLSNAKQIALGVIIYSNDFDDRYPLAANAFDGIMPYIKNRKILTAPDAPDGTISYSFNEKIFGATGASIAAPATCVLLYEGKDHQLNFAHEGKAAVAFCDGHAKLFTPEEAKSLNWDPTK